MKAIIAAVIALFALTQMGYTQTRTVDRLVVEGSCIQGSGGATVGTACSYEQATMTGSLWPSGYQISSPNQNHFVDADSVRSIGRDVSQSGVWSSFTWRTWLLLGVLLASLGVFYRETRGMIGMAFIRPSMTEHPVRR